MPRAAVTALEVLSLLVSQREPMTVAEMNGVLRLSRASTYRLLQSLEKEGWVIGKGDPRRYEPGIRILNLGLSLISGIHLREFALTYALQLAVATERTVFLAVYVQGEVVYTDRIDVLGNRVIPVLLSTLSHKRVSPLLRSAGRAILAFRPESEIDRHLSSGITRFTPYTKSQDEILTELTTVRERGYATLDREVDQNRSGISVPILDRSGFAVAAFAIGTPGKLSDEFIYQVLPKMESYAQRASAELGHRSGTTSLIP